MTPDLVARFSLANRVAIITDASGALATRIAQVLAEADAFITGSVIVADVGHLPAAL